jgi:uncharacterized protein
MVDLKTVIRDSQERAGALSVIDRDIVFDPATLTKLRKIITLTGPRRSGKTSFMVQMMGTLGLARHEIVFLDFSDIVFSDFTASDFPALLSAYQELYPDTTPWFFLDEIQEIDDFERGALHLLNSGARVVITGSSAKLFSEDIATILRGKTLPLRVATLDFKEYLRFRSKTFPAFPSTRERGRLSAEFDRFLRWGGFPEVVLSDSEETRRSLVKSYVDIMLFRDIIDRHAINNSHIAERLFSKLLGSFTREVSITKWFNDFKSAGNKVSKDTLFQYVRYFEDAQFISLLENRNGGATSQKKVYLADNGLFAPLRSLSPDSGKLFENQVFRDLARTGRQFHFLKQLNGDTDFAIGNTAIQACYQLTDDNFDRECRGAEVALGYPGITRAQIVILSDQRTLKRKAAVPRGCKIVDYFLFAL